MSYRQFFVNSELNEVVFYDDLESESEDPLDASDFESDAYKLARSLDIRVLNSHSFIGGFVDENNQVVAALFEPTDFQDCYSFDVVVHPAHQKKGLGSQLVDSAIKDFEVLQSFANDLGVSDFDYCIHVVSFEMKSILESKGFYVYQNLGSESWLMKK
jgi:ribosomal protein S18 acetylase RimI-like enzyme